MQAVIMAGGSNARLHGPYTHIPKPLVSFFDRPVIEHTIRLLAKQRIENIIIAMSPLAGEIARYFGDGSNWGVNIRYSVENEPMGSAGAVKLLQKMVHDTFVVVSGDIITDVDINAAARKHSKACAIASMVLHWVDDPSQFGIVDCDERGKVFRFIEKPGPTEVFSNVVNAGIYILEPDVLSSIPYNTAEDFATNLIPRLLRNQERVFGLELPGYWCDTGDLLHYRNAHFDALQGKLKVDLPAIHIGHGLYIGDGVEVDPSVELSSRVYIGPGASIKRNARLEEDAIIGANVVVDEGAYVGHSIIGAGAYVGRDTKVTDTIIHGDYFVTESGTTGEPPRPAAKPKEFAPAATSVSGFEQSGNPETHQEIFSPSKH